MKLKKAVDFLVSRKFALILLGVLIALSVTGMVIPQDIAVNRQSFQNWSLTNPKMAWLLGFSV